MGCSSSKSMSNLEQTNEFMMRFTNSTITFFFETKQEIENGTLTILSNVRLSTDIEYDSGHVLARAELYPKVFIHHLTNSILMFDRTDALAVWISPQNGAGGMVSYPKNGDGYCRGYSPRAKELICAKPDANSRLVLDKAKLHELCGTGIRG